MNLCHARVGGPTTGTSGPTTEMGAELPAEPPTEVLAEPSTEVPVVQSVGVRCGPVVWLVQCFHGCPVLVVGR